MAQRRMFSKDITENDAFLDMPLSTQALYFHLGMQADDDGFVSPNRIMRMIGSQSDDLKILITKKFVLSFDDGIVVVKHWKINNYLRSDRYKPSKNDEKMALLKENENGSYSWYTNCLPDGIPVVDAGKVSIGKVRKDNTSSSKDEGFVEFWKNYPKKVGKAAAEKSWKKLSPDLPLVLAALEDHKKSSQWTRDNGQYIPHPSTWLNQKRWEDELEENNSTVILD